MKIIIESVQKVMKFFYEIFSVNKLLDIYQYKYLDIVQGKCLKISKSVFSQSMKIIRDLFKNYCNK